MARLTIEEHHDITGRLKALEAEVKEIEELLAPHYVWGQGPLPHMTKARVGLFDAQQRLADESVIMARELARRNGNANGSRPKAVPKVVKPPAPKPPETVVPELPPAVPKVDFTLKPPAPRKKRRKPKPQEEWRAPDFTYYRDVLGWANRYQ